MFFLSLTYKRDAPTALKIYQLPIYCGSYPRYVAVPQTLTRHSTGCWIHLSERTNFVRHGLNQLPSVAQMFLSGEDVSQTDPHNGAAVQFCLGEISAS